VVRQRQKVRYPTGISSDQSQTTTITNQQETIDEQRNRIHSLEIQVAAPTESEKKRREVFEGLGETVKKYGDELRALREQVDTLKDNTWGTGVDH
jgi:hypothetical protein